MTSTLHGSHHGPSGLPRHSKSQFLSRLPHIPSLSWPPSLSSVPIIHTWSLLLPRRSPWVGWSLLGPLVNISIPMMPKFRSPDQKSPSQALYCTHKLSCLPDLTAWCSANPRRQAVPQRGSHLPPYFSAWHLATEYPRPDLAVPYPILLPPIHNQAPSPIHLTS